ncbi:transposase [Methylobacterium bullatum]|uniref:transposase n=1 Tax=Methylobacterium bullatum TaxID=570505 RepID=UPI0030CF32B6
MATDRRHQRTAHAYIFGAIRPEKGMRAGLVAPRCDTSAMNEHLKEISCIVDPGAHAVLILDGIGWHIAHDLVVPDNITLLTLLACEPEFNPAENVWQFLRDNWLGDRILTSYDLDRCCQALKRFVAQLWLIMSIGLHQWAYRLWSIPAGIIQLNVTANRPSLIFSD